MIDLELVQTCLKTTILRPHFIIYDEVGSTNEVAREHILKGAQEGLLVLAGQQSKGRGRYDRHWHSPKGGLYFSMVLKPQIELTSAPLMGLLVSCAVVRGLHKIGVDNVSVKWPNDILLGFDKVAGILCELVPTSRTDFLIIIGVGINQNSRASDFPKDYEYSFTTVRDYIGQTTSQERLLCAIINSIDSLIGVVITEKSYTSILDVWKRMSSTLGNKVRVVDGSEIHIGIAEEILEDGALSVVTEKGKRVVRIGDITHLRND